LYHDAASTLHKMAKEIGSKSRSTSRLFTLYGTQITFTAYFQETGRRGLHRGSYGGAGKRFAAFNTTV